MSIRRDDLDAGRVDLADVIDARRAPMKPVPPGDFLRMEFLEPMKLSAYRRRRSTFRSTGLPVFWPESARSPPTRPCVLRVIFEPTRSPGLIFRRCPNWRWLAKPAAGKLTAR